MQQTTTNPDSGHENEDGRQQQIERNQAAIKLLQSWMTEGDPEEQHETWEIIRKGLEDHPFQIRRDDQ